MSQYNIILSTSESTVVSEYEPQSTRSDAYQSEAALEKAMELSKSLREYGYFAEYDMMGRGLKAQMKYANKIRKCFI